MPRMITLLTNSIGQCIPYDPAIHRSIVLHQITEADIWPDLADCQQRALKILTDAADLELEEFIKLDKSRLAAIGWAQLQFAPIDHVSIADKMIDKMIKSGDIYFATESDRLAAIMPEPEDYSKLPIADTRHPDNPLNKARK